MTLYDRIYSRSTAGTVGMVCIAGLVVTQLTIVAGAVASLRPAWSAWQTWGAAIGFEGGAFAVGMIGAVSGFGGWQIAALAGFVLVSTFFGFDGSMQAQLQKPFLWADLQAADPMMLLRAVIEGSFQAVMYVSVVLSVHRLYAKGEEARHEPAQEPKVVKHGVAVRTTKEMIQRPRPVPKGEGPNWPAIVEAVEADGGLSLSDLLERHGGGVARSTILRGLKSRGFEFGDEGWVRLDDQRIAS